MAKPDNGRIGRLLLLAGPPGAGKSTLLAEAGARGGELAAAVPEFERLAATHCNVRTLSRKPKTTFEELCLHVDIANPVRDLQPRGRADLLDRLTPALFERWQLLSACVARAAAVDVVTLYLPRELHFHRWAYRSLRVLRHGRFPRFHPAIVAINGDGAHNDELHRALYLAWLHYVPHLRPHRHVVVDISASPCRLLDAGALLRELGAG